MALNSSARFKVVDLVCEGPIGGLATDDPYKSVFLNDIALAVEGEKTYKDKVNFDFFVGTSSQDRKLNNRRPGVVQTINTVTVGQEMGHSYQETLNPEDSQRIASKDARDYGQGSVFHKVANPEVASIQPILSVNALYSTSVEGVSRGILFPASLDIRTSVYDGDGKVVFEDYKLIKGIVTNGYQISLNEIDITPYKKPVTLRVHKRAQVRSNNNYNVPIYEQNRIALPADANHYFYINNNGVYTNRNGHKDDYLAKEAAFDVNVRSVRNHESPELFPFGNGRANSVTLTAVKEKVRTSIPYRFSAITSVHVNTEAFPQLPSRSYLIKGLLMRIPNNAVVRKDGSLYFPGNFDGSITSDLYWTTCPVAAWYEMATNTRFGAGLPHRNFSWIDLYPLCKYANERLLINSVTATYSTPFVDQNTGLANINIDRISHGFTTGDTIYVVFTSGPLSETNKTVYEFKVVATIPNTLAIGQNSYITDEGPNMSVHTQGGNCLISNKAEPRFAANMVIGSQAQAYEVLQDLASIFRGMTYWHQNAIQVTADHGEIGKVNGEPSVIEPVHLFTNANVTEDGFAYEGTGLSTRSTSTKVTYNDPENNYKPDFVCVEDTAARDKYGHREREVVGIGCTSRTQAIRMARWILASEQLSDTVIRFSTGLEGALVLPGQVFAVADEVRSGITNIAGRISAKHAVNQVKTDRDLSSFLNGLTGTPVVTMKCVIADGFVEEKTVDVNASKTNTYTDATTGKVRTIIVLTSGQSFSQAPIAGAAYSISYVDSAGSVSEEKYRCLGIEDNGDGTFAINGVKHDDSIYNTTDSNTFKVEKTITTSYSQKPDPPRNLKIIFRRVFIRNTMFYRAAFSYQRGAKGILTVTFCYITIGGTRVNTQTVYAQMSHTFELDRDIAAGEVVEFKVVQHGLNNKAVEASIVKEAPSQDVDEDLVTGIQTTLKLPDVGVEKKRGLAAYSSVFDREVGDANEKSDLTIEAEDAGRPQGLGVFPGVKNPVSIEDQDGNIAVRVSYSAPEQSELIGLEMQVRHTTEIISGEATNNQWNQARVLTTRDAASEETVFNLAWIPGTYMFRYRSVDSGTITYSPSVITRVAPEIEAHRSTSESSFTLPDSNPPPLFRTHRLLCQPFTTLDTANTGDSFEVVAIGSGQSQINTLRLKEIAGTGQFYVPVPGGVDNKILDLGDVFEIEVEAHVVTASLNDQDDSSYQVNLLVYKSDEPYYPEDQLFLMEDDGQILQENDFSLMDDVYVMGSLKPIRIAGRRIITGRRFRFAFLVQKLNAGADNANGVPIFKELEVRIYSRYRAKVVNEQISNDVFSIYDNYKTHEASFSPFAPAPAALKWVSPLGQYSSDNQLYVGEPLSGGPVTSSTVNMNVTQAVTGAVHGVKAMTEGVRYSIQQLDGVMTTGDWQDIGWTGTFPAVGDIFICKRRPRSGDSRVTVLAHTNNQAGVVPKGKHYTVGIFNGSTPIRCRYRIEVVGYGKAVFPNG